MWTENRAANPVNAFSKNGFAYDLSQFDHPKAGPFDGTTNPLFVGNWGAAGNDISFLFQNVGDSCQGLITKASSHYFTYSTLKV